MAKMIPKDIKQLPPNTTVGEKALFRTIEKHTPDEWICYVGQSIRKIGKTPDFLLIGPDLGVLILEEKSLSIDQIKKFTTEKWTAVRNGVPVVEDHPLRQARGYVEKAVQLMLKVKRLTNSNGKLKFVYRHGCVLSNIHEEELTHASYPNFETPPMETFEPDLVICKNHLPSKRTKQSDFAERLKKMTQIFSFKPLNDGDIQSIRSALYPEVRARVMADELDDRNAVLSALTVEQEQMARGIGLNDSLPHRHLRGIAGCGKTIILRTRAADVASTYPDWKILVTFFTRSLKNYLAQDMPKNVTVKTIGQSMYEQWIKNGQSKDEFDVRSEEGWDRMVSVLKQKELSKGIYNAIFLDESQDLRSPEAKYLRHILSEKTNCAFFCGDLAQNIFHQNPIIWKHHGFKFLGRTSKMKLSENYRNSKAIFEFAWEFIREDFSKNTTGSDEIDQTIKLYNDAELKRIGPTPNIKEFKSEEEELNSVCSEIKRLINQERISLKSIAIIHPNATKTFADRIKPYLKNLFEQHFHYYWLSEDNNSKINYDPNDNKICITTPNSAKGLEWDIVFMPSIEKYGGDHPNNLRFVAATRARFNLYPSACN